jgi:hypothetical protein
MLADLPVYVVGPLELSQSKEESHEELLQDRLEDALFPVSSVGDEDLLSYDTEAMRLRTNSTSSNLRVGSKPRLSWKT